MATCPNCRLVWDDPPGRPCPSCGVMLVKPFEEIERLQRELRDMIDNRDRVEEAYKLLQEEDERLRADNTRLNALVDAWRGTACRAIDTVPRKKKGGEE